MLRTESRGKVGGTTQTPGGEKRIFPSPDERGGVGVVEPGHAASSNWFTGGRGNRGRAKRREGLRSAPGAKREIKKKGGARISA